MEYVDSIKLVKICRFCLSQDEEYLIPIAEAPDFSITIQDVARFTGIDINETNKKVYAMCLECTESLKDTAAFRNSCLDNDAIFHELYSAMVSSVNEIYGDTVEYLDSDFLVDEVRKESIEDANDEEIEMVENDGEIEMVEKEEEIEKIEKNVEEDEDGLCLVEFDDCMVEIDLHKALESSCNSQKTPSRMQKSSSPSHVSSIVFQKLNTLLQESTQAAQVSSTPAEESSTRLQEGSFWPESKSLWQQLSSVLQPTVSKVLQKPSDEVVLDENYDPFSYSANYIDIGEPLTSDDSVEFVEDSSDELTDSKQRGKRGKKRFVKRKGGIPKPIRHEAELGPLFSPKPEEPVGAWRITDRCKRKLHLCDECGIYTAHVKSHKRNHNTDPDVQCPHCPKKFKYQMPLNNHIKQVHAKQVCKTCEICGKGFIHHKTYRYHMLDHASAGKKFECEHCRASFSNHIYLRDHFNRMHNILRTKNVPDSGSS